MLIAVLRIDYCAHVSWGESSFAWDRKQTTTNQCTLRHQHTT